MSAPDESSRDSTAKGSPPQNPAAPIAVRRALEQLRQEQETFNQRKQQDSRWFQLRMAMGCLAVLIVPSIVAICVLLLTDPHQDPAVKGLAASTLLVDIAGLVGAVWKVV